MYVPEEHGGLTDKQTNKWTRLFVSLFDCVLDGVWHILMFYVVERWGVTENAEDDTKTNGKKTWGHMLLCIICCHRFGSQKIMLLAICPPAISTPACSAPLPHYKILLKTREPRLKNK